MDARVRLICDLLETNQQPSLRLSEIARTANLSVSRTCHLFKAETGVTIRRRLREIRTRRAKRLLETTLSTVKEVAALVGYSSSSHFAKTFRETHGASPVQVKAQALAGAARRESR